MNRREPYLDRNRFHSILCKPFWAAALLVCLLAGPSCSLLKGNPVAQIQPSQSTASGDGQTTPPTSAAIQELALAKPIQVDITLEEDRVALADVNDQGGQGSAVSSSGVEFHLSVPPGALPGDYEIRMTPVKSMEGLPLSGGLLGAVKMEPEGLIFLKPASLTVILPAGIPPEEVTPFAYQGNGESLYYYPAMIEGNRLTFQISHFSGFGSGQGSPEETNGWPSAPANSPGGDYQQDVGDYCRQHCGKADFDPKKMAEYFRKWFTAAIYPALQAAEKDDSTVDAAGAAFLDWARQVSFLSLDEYLAKELKAGATSFLKGLANSVDQSYRRCMQVDAYQASKMLRRIREIAMMNGVYGGTAPKGYTYEDKKPELRSCLTFKLQVTSLIEWSFEDSEFKMTTQVAGEITLRLNTDTRLFDGSGSLETKQFSVEGIEEDLEEGTDVDETCNVDYGSLKSTTLEVKDAQISWQGEDESSATARVRMVLKPEALMTDSVKIKCWHYMRDGVTKAESEGQLPSVPTWSGGFATVHEDRRFGEGFLFSEFETGSGQLFARFADSKETTKMVATVSDDLTLDLFHTPGE